MGLKTRMMRTTWKMNQTYHLWRGSGVERYVPQSTAKIEYVPDSDGALILHLANQLKFRWDRNRGAVTRGDMRLYVMAAAALHEASQSIAAVPTRIAASRKDVNGWLATLTGMALSLYAQPAPEKVRRWPLSVIYSAVSKKTQFNQKPDTARGSKNHGGRKKAAGK